jgi:hypothetical protein
MWLWGWHQETLERLYAAEVQEKEPFQIEWAHFDGKFIRK